MGQPIIQTSFNSGEWAPALNARVDLARYHSGAALLRNFFVDYRGGATTRPGTRYIAQAYNSTTQVRIIPFQASFNVSYLLEFGNNYIRFYNNGLPVLEGGINITGITQANPGVVTAPAHGYANGQWVVMQSVGGMTQLNNNTYVVANATTNTFTLIDLQGNVVDTTTFGAFTSGGQSRRVYTLATTFTPSELFQIKYAQNLNTLVLCHPNHQPQVLVLGNSPYNWTISNIVFGTPLTAPTGLTAATTLAAGTVNYSYVVTTVDINGQESAISNTASVLNAADIRSTAGTNTITWGAVTGAASYNIYKANPRYSNPVPAGSQYGFAGNVTGTTFIDSNITPNFAIGAPIVQNPFSGAGVASVNVTSGGTNLSGLAVPTVSFSGGSPTTAATATALVGVASLTVAAAGVGYAIGDTVFVNGAGSTANGIFIQVVGLDGNSGITAFVVTSYGTQINYGTVPANSQTSVGQNGSRGNGALFNLNWVVQGVQVTSPGAGYSSAPSVAFSTGSATATAVLGASSAGNPTVPGFFQQRLVLAAPPLAPNQFNMSQPGSPYNFNITNPVEPSNAIQASLYSGKLNSIRSMVPVPAGLILMADQQAWLVNGGGPGTPIAATALVANAQSYTGASDLPPIVASYDILYVQSKSSIVRDLAYNFYTNVYAGNNISILSSHLFYSYTLVDWCWAEEPLKIVWAVRNDGVLLSLTYVKDQELIAWAHHDTVGSFRSVATIPEVGSAGLADAVYVVVDRVVNGVTVKYIERLVDLYYPQGYKSSWFLDAGINYTGAPATNFSGAKHLGGMTVTGVADGAIIPSFTMPLNGSFTLATAASNVTIGLPITGQLQTLALDLGEPTVQGKRKKVSAVSLMVNQTLGLSVGKTFSSLVPIKDLILNNVSTMLQGQPSQIVTDLVTGYARTILDPTYDVPGQYCFQQTQPYPATILGVIPEIEVGDRDK